MKIVSRQVMMLPVRALDGRSTTVRMPAAASVRDLKAALVASFPPAQAAPEFHLFLRGGKLILDGKVADITLARGEFISLISFSTARPIITPQQTSPSPAVLPRNLVPRPAVFQTSPSPYVLTRNPLPRSAVFQTSPSVNRTNPRPRAAVFAATTNKKRKLFSSSSWRGEDMYARVVGGGKDHASPYACCRESQQLDAAQMVEHLKQGLGKHGQIRHVREIPGREASFAAALPPDLSPATRNALMRIGVSRLYSHQAEAIAAAVSGRHVVISTGTCSGKSLCYNIPVLEAMESTASCALYMFPTKALAQDQLKTLLHMSPGLEEHDARIYDGDTPVKDRGRIRDAARVLITNPDMLHVSILPSHAQFRRILSNLRYIVIDEAHSYKGAFGCHAALVLRRLKRLCQAVYGSHPTFIFCTATLANPRQHVVELAKLDDGAHLIHKDGSPYGSKHFVLWNPSSSSSSSSSSIAPGHQPTSPIQEVSCLFAEMVRHGLRCIAFCKTRKLCELVLARTRDIFEETAPIDLADSIAVYRGGYVAEDRRQIEADLFGGKLRGVAATNALELGIDVGHIDATLHLGFPGSMASFWQQAGRSGRRSKQSLAVYVAFEGPLDQYFMNFPDMLFGKPVEHCQVDSSNPKILGQHLACAAYEKPLHLETDEAFFGSASSMAGALTTLKHKGHVVVDNTSVWKYAGPEKKKPSQSVSIRAIEHDRYRVIDVQGYKLLEEIEESKAFFQVYQGAVYMHQGISYLVERLDLSSRTAYCKAVLDLDYYTKIRNYIHIKVLLHEPADFTAAPQASDCKVTTDWVEFRRIWKSNDKISDTVQLHLPPYSFHTQAAWIHIPPQVRAAVKTQRNLDFPCGVHAASHALQSIVPLHLMCSASDLGTRCHVEQGSDNDRILLYDKHPGGIGLASQVKRLFGELLLAALQLVSTCSCTNSDGCPSCIQSFACGDYNKNLDKQAALLILRGVVQNEGLSFGRTKDASH